jgi:hypothetical protein
MKIARLALFIASCLLLGGGYVASVLNYPSEQRASYYERIDQQPIVMLALLLFVGSVVLGLIPARGEDAES